jgi:putative heme-binding domain-containing protein
MTLNLLQPRLSTIERAMALIVALLVTSVLHAADPASTPLPHWIWTAATAEITTFTKTLDLSQPPQQATLQVAGDFCHVTVRLNDETVLSVEDYSPIATTDVTQFLRAGANRITISGVPTSGPSAVALGLDVMQPDGSRTRLISDETWRNDSANHAVSLGEVAPELWGDGARSIEISPFDNYEQWRQAIGTEANNAGGRFWSAPQFEIELVRAAGPDEGSWISIAFDRQGRATIAREDKGLLRFTFDRPGGAATQVETIDDTLLECRGLCYLGDELYVNANNSKSVCVLRDADGDGKLDEPAVVREFPGGVGHGRNQLKRGADGQVYAISGDSVEVPRDMFDRTSPFRERRRGEATSEGFVAAMNPATATWELFCAGMRNPFGIAFNSDGEPFTYDADAEFDMGAPWYRPTRILHLVSGADYGWRGVTGRWPPYDADHPDNALPVFDIGKGSPTAAEFGYRSNFPPRYRDALYVLDWAYGRVLAVHLQPRGAGYVAQAETFLQGQPLNVCCLDFGPDGAMYLVTGGRKTKSGLYRVRFTGEQPAPIAASQHIEQCMAHSRSARESRRRLEEFHGLVDVAALDAAWPYLDSADPALRYAARTAVEHQPVSTWKERALAETRTTASLTALLALARSREPDVAGSILRRTTKLDFAALTLRQKLSLLYLHILCLDLQPEAIGEWRPKLLAQLDAAFPDPAANATATSPMGDGRRLQRELSRLLLRLDAPHIVDRIIAQLAAATTQEDRMHVLFLLRDVRDGWTPETHRIYFTALRDTDQYRGGEGMPGFLRTIREAATARLSNAEREELAPLLASSVVDEPLPATNRQTVQKWTLDDLADIVLDSASRGDARRGATIFREALCTRCHRVGATGPAVGPDLTYVGRRFAPRDILQSILLPSQVVAENYRNVEVVTTDGRVIIGRPLTAGDYRAEKLRIATDPLRPSVVVELDKKEIELHRLAQTSPMPTGLLDAFTREEIADLLAYLTSGVTQ